MSKTISVKTRSRTEFIDITGEIRDFVRDSGIESGLCVIFIPHTTAAVTINENADPSVTADIKMGLDKLVPYADGYAHMEGNSDAHIKSSLFGCSEHVIIENSSLLLGTWQGIYFCEFDGPRTRRAHIKIISE